MPRVSQSSISYLKKLLNFQDSLENSSLKIKAALYLLGSQLVTLQENFLKEPDQSKKSELLKEAEFLSDEYKTLLKTKVKKAEKMVLN